MKNQEYQLGQDKSQNQPEPTAPGMGGGGGESAENFMGTWGKLLKYCKKYHAALIIALICAVIGTVFTLVGPDKLSEMTDCITEGIAPDTDKLEEISITVSDNISDNMELVIGGIVENTKVQIGEAQIKPLIINGSEISPEDQLKTLELMSNQQELEQSETGVFLTELPQSVIQALYTDIEIEDSVITGKDQKEMMEVLSNINTEDTNAAMEALDQLPDSVYHLIKPHIDMEKVVGIGLTLVALYVASYVLSAFQGWVMATITQKVSQNMRSDISKKINRLPMWYYNRTTNGDVLSRVTNDVDTIGQSLNQSIGNLITSVVLFVGCLFMMIKTNGIMTLTAVLSTLIGFVLMFLIMGKSQKYFTKQQEHLGKINGHIEEIYAGHTVVKAYNGEEEAEKTFHGMNEKLRVSGFRAQCLSGLMMPIMSFIGNFGYVAVCVVGGVLVLNGKIGFGVIVAFMLYIRYFTQPLSQIAQAMQSLQSAAAAGERVFEFLEAEEMENEDKKRKSLGKAEGNVVFDHIRFGYEDSDKTVIHDFSLDVKKGQKIAIVGPTGAGKSTIVNLLMRFHEIQSGEIRIDGVSVKELKREEVHAQFCMVLQDTWLFEGTVRENLIYCTEGVSDEKMYDACRAVGLDHFIRTLPKGYDTVLNDQVNLSQGQKQQLTIARAMIADKPMLILDEATSSVDTRTELLIQKAMDQLMKNRTSFVIAHRLSTIKNADLILVLKDGDIIESGNHKELMKKHGFYADLYNSQFEQAS